MSDAIETAFRGRLGTFEIDVAFSAKGQGVTALFGPSGCGKTTVLRAIAGLQRLDGICRVGGEVWQDAAGFRPTHRRAVGYVFQEPSLFPHLSVTGNLLYGAPDRQRPADFDEVIDLLGLERLLDRAPAHLSGGERQRVAIGRALISNPRLLLMDEPLAALDRPTKDEIMPFLERLHRRRALPILYVSHDVSEVERLADDIVLMRAGRVLAAGPLAELQTDPALPLAKAREAAVSMDAMVTGVDTVYGLARLQASGGEVFVPAAGALIGERRRIRIAAGDVSLALHAPVGSTILNVLPARIVSAQASQAHDMTVVLALGRDGEGARLLARITRRSWETLGLSPGQSVFAQVKGVALAPAADLSTARSAGG